MGGIDIFLGLVLIWGTIQGVRQGFFAALISFVAYFIGIYIAIEFSHLVAEKLVEVVDWEIKTIEISAFALTFVAVVILLFVTAKFFTKLADWAYLGWINRLLGGLFGLLKYTLLLSVVLLFFNKINRNNYFMSEETKEESIFYNKIEYTAELIYPSIKAWVEEFKDPGSATQNSEADTEKTE
ncbi:CvpA family protein [Flavobacterium agricola]|uniref:CvpA family protein n=1 Tax=Flavobacterium agricola TaxID=2870839 RepID=A0ABY6LXU4_9FLAO|nr:CvpA family protein [Flavobacterium agricola]UYW01064.1 CvpA family protein [Flavobacterium agricola]